MNKVSMKLTVLYEHPFWIGLVEVEDETIYSVGKFLFGAEPKDYEVYQQLWKLNSISMSSPIQQTSIEQPKVKNPKRLQRMIRDEMKNKGIGTKSQQALKLQQEQYKKVKATERKEQLRLHKELKYLKQQAKKKAKHRGK